MSMGMTIKDFRTESLSTGDFKLDKNSTALTYNSTTVAQVAAGEAIMSAQPTVENFRTIREDLLSPQGRANFTLRQEQKRRSIMQDAQQEISNVLLDNNLSNEEKMQFIEGSKASPETMKITPMDVLAQSAVLADSSPNESEEEYENRLDYLGVVEEVTQHKQNMQSRLNSIAAARDSELGKKAKDFAELMLPFAEWINVDAMYRDLYGKGIGEGKILMGSQRQKLFEVMETLPYDQRAEASEKLIDYVNNNDQVVFSNGNDMIAMDTLNNMVLNNDYTNTEKWFDNFFSVLDISGVVGAAVRAVKAPAQAAEGARLAKEAEQFQKASRKRPRSREEVKLEREAQEFQPKEEGPVDEALAREAQEFKPETPPKTSLEDEAEGFRADPEPTVEQVFRETEKRAVHTDVKPSSPSQHIKDANPQKSRALHEVVAGDPSDEAAEALYGTTRTEALSKDLLPEPEIKPNRIPNKVKMDGPDWQEPLAIRDARQRDGNSYLSTTEAERVRQRVTEGLENVEGMVVQKQSTTIREGKNGGLNINMMYRPMDTGFRTAARAMENAKFAFRHYGLDESQMKLYRRQGDEWVETNQKELAARKELRDGFSRAKKKIPADLKDIDYAVGINYDYKFRPEDLQGYDVLNTNKVLGLPVNLLDRARPGMLSPAKAGQGSLTQNLLDAASTLHPQIVEPAAVAVDKGVKLEKLYRDQFAKFTKGWNSLKQARRALMTDYIHEANFKGIKFEETDLRARGFNSDEVELLKEWRKANDVMYYAANDDMAINLRNRGFRIFVHDESDTRLFVKPVKRGSISPRTQYYNPSTGAIESMRDSTDIDAFYEAGGTFAKLDEPMEIDGQWVDMVRSGENVSEGYLKAIKDGENVLAYRQGYYPVMYDANFFITRKYRKADGTEFRKTIASAKTKTDAEHLVKNIREKEGLAVDEVEYRPDRRESPRGIKDQGVSLGISSGMSAQKARGVRLKDAGVDLHLAGSSNLHDPLEAISTQIRQLSTRVSMRNYLDTTKRRWVENYAERVGLSKDFNGEYKFPTSLDEIKPVAGVSSQVTADARTLFNYVTSLENGYVNAIDELFKGTFNFGADLMSGLKWKKGEETLRDWGQGSLTSAGKAAVFKMFLAANPARQLIIQAHQTVQLSAINPTYIAGPMQWDLYRLGRAMRGYKGDKEALDMLDELTNSGMMEAVDANNLVRSDMLQLANVSTARKMRNAAEAPLNVAQKIGFDTAERAVLVTSWLAHRDMAVKAGKKLTRRTYDEIAGKARGFTYNMNRAGDMPYNQNTLNVIAQFLQVPHKAMLQPLINQGLTRRQRAQLLTWNTVMFGVPVGAVSFLHNNMEPGATRDALEHGLEDIILNETLSAVTGEEQQIDWGDLAPSDLHGMGEFVVGLWTTDIGKMLAESPSGSLIAGGNPRLKNLFTTTARWVHLRDDYEDPTLDTKYTDVLNASLNLFSGYSNGFKSKYAWETGKKLNSVGNVSDADVTKAEAAMQFFGFQTRTEVSSREINEIIYKNQSFDGRPGGDVDKWYSELKRQLARRGQTVDELDMAQRILTEGMRVFQDDPVKFQDRLYSLIKSDVEDNQYNIIERIIDQTGWKSREEVNHLVEKLPQSDVKDQLRGMINQLGDQ